MNKNKLFSFISALLVLVPATVLAQSSAPSTSAPQGTSRESLEIVDSPWGASFWGIASISKPNEGEIKRRDYLKEDTKAFSYSYLSLNYKLNSIERLALRTPFIYMSVGQSTMKFIPLDLFINYSNSSLMAFDSILVSGGLRLYLPTSQQAYDSKMLMGFRTELSAKIKMNQWKWSYYFKPDFYIYEQNEYKDTSRGNMITSTKMIKLEHYIEGERSLSRVFGLRPYLGFEDTWFNAADKRTKSNLKTDLVARLGLDINFSRNFSISIGVENKTGLTNRQKDWVPLSPEDNSISLLTYASI
ncbi:MAG TPA: hypothetical protein PLJ21_06615 [Pseudobdellovibrionaceae bacterium]|nr:hypothetical protein [Pseudobdellovibrionaceae bacterium]